MPLIFDALGTSEIIFTCCSILCWILSVHQTWRVNMDTGGSESWPRQAQSVKTIGYGKYPLYLSISDCTNRSSNDIMATNDKHMVHMLAECNYLHHMIYDIWL